jgi:hypothetical protein
MKKTAELVLQGAKIEAPNNPGTWIGQVWRQKICTLLTCLLNPRLTIPVDSGDGIPVPKDAVITMGRNGWTAVFPALAAPGGTGSGTTTTFQITSVFGGDYVVAQTWDGTTLGGVDFYIAKPIHFRTSFASEVVDGVTINYTYSDDNHVHASDGTHSVDALCCPRYVVAAEIQASLCNNGTPVLDGSGNVVKWIDLTPREWISPT